MHQQTTEGVHARDGEINAQSDTKRNSIEGIYLREQTVLPDCFYFGFNPR